jgi:putative ABC transport system ATP-binding protein
VTATTQMPIVEVEDVWKLYRRGDEVVQAVQGANLTVRRGEFVCLMGPSGSGKSTLLYLLGGLDRPTRGSIQIDGKPTARLTESQFAALRHSTIGFIFQSFNLIPFLSAVENVELPLIFEPIDRRSLHNRAVALLGMVGLGHRVHHTPGRLSGGEQQRVAVARSLISEPSVIFADEPTANLDRRSGAEVVQILKDLCTKTGVAVVAATHDPIVAQEGTNVVTMEDGRLTQIPS